MNEQREKQLKEWLTEAEAVHKVAAQEHQLAQIEGEKILAKAREEREVILAKANAERQKVMAAATKAEKDAREECKSIEKMLKINRHEPLNPAPKTNQVNGHVPSEILDQIFAEAQKQAAESEDGGFTIGSLNDALEGIGPETIRDGVDQMRREDPKRMRPRGRRKNGQLFKLWEREV